MNNKYIKPSRQETRNLVRTLLTRKNIEDNIASKKYRLGYEKHTLGFVNPMQLVNPIPQNNTPKQIL
jgi:hypothetical protein